MPTYSNSLVFTSLINNGVRRGLLRSADNMALRSRKSARRNPHYRPPLQFIHPRANRAPIAVKSAPALARLHGNWHADAPGSRVGLLPPSPLRTAHKTFALRRSSLS